MESATLSSCYADPNFAIICAFFEKFGKMCGVPFPMASELVGMLECENGGMFVYARRHIYTVMRPT